MPGALKKEGSYTPSTSGVVSIVHGLFSEPDFYDNQVGWFLRSPPTLLFTAKTIL